MIKFLIAFTAVVSFFATGCSTKSKNTNTESSASGEKLETESVGFDIKGSDSGKIQGLNTVFFEFDKSTLTDKEQRKLAMNAMWLKNNPNAKLVIEGHADEIGSSEYNLSLGERRANFVRTQLVKLGVKSSRLTVTSFGEEKPIAQGDSESAMAQNRRANFVPN